MEANFNQQYVNGNQLGNAINNVSNDLVAINEHGKNVTTSLIVANVFGKRHSDVLRDIRNLNCSEDFRKRNFALIENQEVSHSPIISNNYFEITEDGFAFLGMGYTGEKAGKLKEEFLSAFNHIRALINSEDYILARAQNILNNKLLMFQQKIQMLEGQNEILTQERKILEPKAKYTDEVLQSTSTFTTTQMADDFGMTANALNKKLEELGVQYKQSGQWHLTSKYKDKGYTDIRVTTYTSGDVTRTSQSMVWTETGRMFLNGLRKEGKI